MKISVVGLGKLGYPMAEFLSSSGDIINCYDADKKLIQYLAAGKNPLHFENELLDFINNGNKLNFFSSLEESIIATDICFITVPTNSLPDNSFDNSIILEVLKEIAPVIKKMKKKYFININSTVSPGSFDEVFIPFLEKENLQNNVDYSFIYNPYFVALGDVVKNLRYPDYVLIGTDNEEPANFMKQLYTKIYDNLKICNLNFKEAELVKLLTNTFLTLKVSYTNLVKNITNNEKNVNVKKVLDTISTDSRIGNKFMSPGGPFSGPCLPRDNQALMAYCKKINAKNYLSNGIVETNDQSKKNIFEDLKILKSKKFKSIGFAGIGYKANSSTIEQSVTFDLLNHAIDLNFEVNLYEKYINYTQFEKLKEKINLLSSLNELEEKSEVIFLPYKDNNFRYFDNSNKIIWDIWSQVTSKKKVSNTFMISIINN